jgi:glucose/arabinose dehydrogenase
MAQSAPITKEKIMMNKSFGVFLAALFSASLAYAQATAPATPATPAAPAKPSMPSASAKPAASNCEAQAVSKSGKPLAGAAKASFMKKCEAGGTSAASSSCEAKAVGKNGKPLAGAAKASFMKKCEKEG